MHLHQLYDIYKYEKFLAMLNFESLQFIIVYCENRVSKLKQLINV